MKKIPVLENHARNILQALTLFKRAVEFTSGTHLYK